MKTAMQKEEVQITKILSQLTAEEFIGRKDELDLLLHHAAEKNDSKAMLLLSAPAIGLTELLRQTYDRLFLEQDEIIPVYFSFSRNDISAEQAAKRFLQSFLLQVVAFRRKDKKLLDASPDICEISELSMPADGYWIDRLVTACESNSRLKDERSFVKQALSAAQRAKSHGANVFVMFDNFHYVENAKGNVNLLDELLEVYERSIVPFVFGGRRRYLLKAVQGSRSKLSRFEVLKLEGLAETQAKELVSFLAENSSVEVNPQSTDLIVQQFRGNPACISSLFQSAVEAKDDLDSFQALQQIYVDSVLGKRICKCYSSLLDEITPNLKTQSRIIDLLANENGKTPIETWRNRLNLSEEEFRRVIHLLNLNEVIRIDSGLIEFSADNTSLKDYVYSRYRLEVVGESRALVVGNLLAESLKRAPQIMTKYYRRSAAIGIRELLAEFNCQEVSLSLLDYAKFNDQHKGGNDDEVLQAIEAETEKISLPHIVYTANSVSFYPPINQFTDDERSAVALGFETGNYTDANEVVWIVAEVDSKLEAARELAEFWCDRLEMVALMCNFSNYRIWLITPEGFSPEAIEILKQREAFGSSRKQVELLAKHLNIANLIAQPLKVNEYEMVVPMGEDTEMIAAHAIEDIARRHAFPQRSINQMKTALVEACINASEHSLSPDRKIYQKFTVEDDKLIITISNRGVKIPADKAAQTVTQIEPDEGRRGWGLKLMRNLMDEVKFEQVDDGTRISMVKYLFPQAK